MNFVHSYILVIATEPPASCYEDLKIFSLKINVEREDLQDYL